MNSKIIKYSIELEFETTNNAPIHIKDWWVHSILGDALDKALIEMERKSTDLSISCSSGVVHDE